MLCYDDGAGVVATPAATAEAWEPGLVGVFDGFFVEYDMARYPILAYPKKEVVRVGDTLRRRIPEDRPAEALHAFRVAYDWRNSHAYPMRKIRRELGGRVRKLHIEGIAAARMKRMSSIRKKLKKLPFNLTQIQDLGGCRAILPSIDNVRALIAAYRAGASIHMLRNETDYIERPKPDGYRSFHFVLSFQGQDEELIYDGRRIEVQIRTELQHSWATAVEAVGLFRDEDLKAGEGDSDWLRLFALMGSEFAEIEKSPLVAGTPAFALRRQELRYLNHKLKAVDTLENLSQAFRRLRASCACPTPDISF